VKALDGHPVPDGAVREPEDVELRSADNAMLPSRKVCEPRIGMHPLSGCAAFLLLYAHDVSHPHSVAGGA